jgi:hypothetical protein
MRRVFAVDVLACPDCHGAMRWPRPGSIGSRECWAGPGAQGWDSTRCASQGCTAPCGVTGSGGRGPLAWHTSCRGRAGFGRPGSRPNGYNRLPAAAVRTQFVPKRRTDPLAVRLASGGGFRGGLVRDLAARIHGDWNWPWSINSTQFAALFRAVTRSSGNSAKVAWPRCTLRTTFGTADRSRSGLADGYLLRNRRGPVRVGPSRSRGWHRGFQVVVVPG